MFLGFGKLIVQLLFGLWKHGYVDIDIGLDISDSEFCRFLDVDISDSEFGSFLDVDISDSEFSSVLDVGVVWVWILRFEYSVLLNI